MQHRSQGNIIMTCPEQQKKKDTNIDIFYKFIFKMTVLILCTLNHGTSMHVHIIKCELLKSLREISTFFSDLKKQLKILFMKKIHLSY